MLATSTHDNKRGEYVRMRINVISEDPPHWSGLVAGWREAVERLMGKAGMTRLPAPGDLYLLFQTFIGTWPIPSGDRQDYAGRLKAYMTKATREAKLHTSWTEPDADYEDAVHRLIDLVLADDGLVARISEDVRPFAWFGALNSLSLTALKLTVPGVPDIYQGANVLDDSLVDPDNRRPVDFDARKEVIRELVEIAAGPAEGISDAVGRWLGEGDFARLKLWTIHRLLGWRALHPQLFESGDYRPVPVSGPRARHCVVYVRTNARHGVLVLATRLYRQLGYPGPDGQSGSAAVAWDDTVVDLGAAGIRAVNPRNLLLEPTTGDATGRIASLAESVPVASLLDRLPIAVISFDVGPS